jgi:hypothetical protein
MERFLFVEKFEKKIFRFEIEEPPSLSSEEKPHGRWPKYCCCSPIVALILLSIFGFVAVIGVYFVSANCCGVGEG